MRDRILGTLGILLGGGLLLTHLAAGTRIDFSSPYAAGRSTALLVGALMALAGVRAILRSFRGSGG